MKQLVFLMISLSCLYQVATAQKEIDVNWNPGKRDIAFYESRAYVSEPDFGLLKVKELIRKEGRQPGGEEAPFEFDRGISKKAFNNLSIEERFTYTMIHPELYSQACAEQLYMKKPEQKIFAQLLSVYSGEEWSERQLRFMTENKAAVMALLEQSVRKSGKMGLNYKTAYVRMDAWEAIPYIISFYKKNKKDKDVLTVLMLLMKEGQYPGFTGSKVYPKLYGKDLSYDESVTYSVANEKFILETAHSYYQSKSNQ